MSANNNNWVCFECRTVRRTAKTVRQAPKCTVCGEACFCLGYKVEVPPAGNVREWRRLRDECRRRALKTLEAHGKTRVRRIHEAEREIVRLRALGPNRSRKQMIARLKEIAARSDP